jgi:outer membrane lipoprotein-sorting protein
MREVLKMFKNISKIYLMVLVFAMFLCVSTIAIDEEAVSDNHNVVLEEIPSIKKAKTPEAKGIEIAKEVDRRDNGYRDIKTDLTMVLINQHGQESIRYLKMQIIEVKDDGDKSLILFLEPNAVRGTSFLTHTHKIGSDDQWLYLPALKRVKRIASNNKSGSFMGTEFSYEDVAPHEIAKYDYKYIKSEKFNDLDCYVVELYPKDPNTGYSKLVLWYDKKEFRRQKIEFFDRKGTHTKTLLYIDYHKYINKYWYSHEFHITNHITGKSTKLIWKNIKLRSGFRQRDFDSKALYRIKL